MWSDVVVTRPDGLVDSIPCQQSLTSLTTGNDSSLMTVGDSHSADT